MATNIYPLDPLVPQAGQPALADPLLAVHCSEQDAH